MRYIADFHLHSSFSRATSSKITLESMNHWAKVKGINILSVADFTHPVWYKTLKKKLEETAPGLYQLKNFSTATSKSTEKTKPYFILTTELSCIYSQKDKTRRLHLLVFAPNLLAVEKINQKLGQRFNLSSDGRPILGISAKELLKIILDISPDCFVVPCHAWTPWYAVFGSKSGFDSIEECFEEQSKNIFALETGLSSDVLMNRLLSSLDKYTLISNSDAHSEKNFGREANVFNLTELSYKNIINTIKTKRGFDYTIEFYPEEGKYHWDGHRDCNVFLPPEEAEKTKNICPKCGKPLTIGVLHRVKELADRKEPFLPPSGPGFKNLIPLAEIISQVLKVGKQSKKVENVYFDLIKKGGSEFNILLDLTKKELEKIDKKISEAIILVREGEVIKNPGYDGVYGEIKIKFLEEDNKNKNQKTLF